MAYKNLKNQKETAINSIAETKAENNLLQKCNYFQKRGCNL